MRFSFLFVLFGSSNFEIRKGSVRLTERFHQVCQSGLRIGRAAIGNDKEVDGRLARIDRGRERPSQPMNAGELAEFHDPVGHASLTHKALEVSSCISIYGLARRP